MPVALDFDIEGDAMSSPMVNGVNTIDLRNQALAGLAADNPGIQISFTVPVAPSGFMDPEFYLFASAIKYKVPVAVVNIMPFDFGERIASGLFGAVTISTAAHALAQLQSAGLESALAITVLIGTSDENDETFQLSDAQAVLAYAESESRIQRLTFWEVSRDNGSCGNAPSDLDDNNCSSIEQSDWAFSKIFEAFAERRVTPGRGPVARP
jgi:hypothetical protein